MANVMRWRYGETNPVSIAVASATVISIGDLIYLDTTAKPAGDAADAGTEAANQEAFHDAFIGVAMTASADGETDPVRVATTGVFEYPCPSSSYALGTLLGVDEASGGTALEDQKVDEVATANLAIGRVVQETSSETEVKVAIVSTIIFGGPQSVI